MTRHTISPASAALKSSKYSGERRIKQRLIAGRAERPGNESTRHDHFILTLRAQLASTSATSGSPGRRRRRDRVCHGVTRPQAAGPDDCHGLSAHRQSAGLALLCWCGRVSCAGPGSSACRGSSRSRGCGRSELLDFDGEARRVKLPPGAHGTSPRDARKLRPGPASTRTPPSRFWHVELATNAITPTIALLRRSGEPESPKQTPP